MMAAAIHLVMMGGLVVAFPVATISVYQLASPLLSRQQRRFVALFLPAILLCYGGGVAFAYFVMLPVGLTFLLNFGGGIAVPLISITEYMGLVTAMLFWLGVVFELPLVMFLLTKLRLVRYEQFRRFSRNVPVAALILGALLTPTFDAVNQLMVAVPIIVLFGVGLGLSWLARQRPRKQGNSA
jgi:sec-independent protein translocase protein TatC